MVPEENEIDKAEENLPPLLARVDVRAYLYCVRESGEGASSAIEGANENGGVIMGCMGNHCGFIHLVDHSFLHSLFLLPSFIDFSQSVIQSISQVQFRRNRTGFKR